MNTVLQSILEQLSNRDSKVRNAKVQLDAVYAESPSALDEVLVHPNPCFRLLTAAYLYGRDPTPSETQRDHVLEHAAKLYSIRMSKRDREVLSTLDHYTDIPGISYFLQRVGAIALDQETPDSAGLWPAASLVICDAYALSRIPALYRIHCNLIMGVNLYPSVMDGRQGNIHRAWQRCHDVPNKREAFYAKYPGVACDDRFITMDEYSRDFTWEKYEATIMANQAEAIGLVKELLFVPAQAGWNHGGTKRLAIASILWRSGVAHELVQPLMSVIRWAMSQKLGGDIEGKPGEYPEIDRLLAWIFGETNESLHDVMPTRPRTNIRIAQDVCHFIGYAAFPARFIQYAFAVNYEDARYYVFSEISNRDLTAYLITHGWDKKELFKLYARLDDDGAMAPGAIEVMLEDPVTTRTIYPEIDNETRGGMIRHLYRWLDPKHAPPPDLGLLVDALMFDYRDFIDDNPLHWALESMSCRWLAERLAMLPEIDAIHERLANITKDTDEKTTDKARKALAAIFGTSA